MKQKKTEHCAVCERYFSPEGLQNHRKIVHGWSPCFDVAFYKEAGKRHNVITTDWDEIENRFANA